MVYFFFPKGSLFFWQGMRVFSAYSSFQTGKCPSLPGDGGGTARLGAPTTAGGFWLRAPQLPKGDLRRRRGEPQGSPEPRAALGKGVPGAAERWSPRAPQPGRGEETHPAAVPAKPA